MPDFIFGNAPAGRRFPGAYGRVRTLAGATCRALSKRRPVTALQKVCVEVRNANLAICVFSSMDS